MGLEELREDKPFKLPEDRFGREGSDVEGFVTGGGVEAFGFEGVSASE